MNTFEYNNRFTRVKEHLCAVKSSWLYGLFKAGASDDEVDMIDKETFISGSCIYTVMTWGLMKHGDVDIFCSTERAAKAIIKVYNYGRLPTMEMTSSGNIVTTDNINIIAYKWDDPQIMVSRFDFDHAKAFITSDGLFTCDEMMLAAISNILVYNRGTSSPFVSLQRAVKFLHRGMKLSEENLIKIVIGIRSLSDEAFQKDLEGTDYVDFRLVSSVFNKEID